MNEHLVVLNNELHRLHELLKYLLMAPDRHTSDFHELTVSTLQKITDFQNFVITYDTSPKLKPVPNVTPIK